MLLEYAIEVNNILDITSIICPVDHQNICFRPKSFLWITRLLFWWWSDAHTLASNTTSNHLTGRIQHLNVLFYILIKHICITPFLCNAICIKLLTLHFMWKFWLFCKQKIHQLYINTGKRAAAGKLVFEDF